MVATINGDDLPPVVADGTERYVLQVREELRLEVGFSSTISFTLLKGSCELYGCELALNKQYQISGSKIALFTWHGCVLDVGNASQAESIYTSDETDANVAYVNTHAQLEALRDEAAEKMAAAALAANENSGNNNNNTTISVSGPRVLVVGPAESGKTTLTKILTAYACKTGRTPLMVDLDPVSNFISVPGSIAVAPMHHSAITIPSYAASTNGLPANSVHPLVLFHGSGGSGSNSNESSDNNNHNKAQPLHPTLFKAQVDHLAQCINTRLQSDPAANASGMIVNTNGWIRDEGYDLLKYIVESLSISVILVLGHDRLYSMLKSHYKKMQMQIGGDNDNPHQNITAPRIVKLPRSGGVVSPPKDYQRQCRSRSVKKYFYGDVVVESVGEGGGDSKEKSKASAQNNNNNKTTRNQLTPFLVQLPLSELKIYKVSSISLASSLLPVNAQQQSTDAIQLEEIDLDDAQGGSSDKDVREILQHALLSVCHPSAVAKYEETGIARSLITAGVAGFCVVERLVEETGQIHLLSPCAGALPSKTLIVGDITWME